MLRADEAGPGGGDPRSGRGAPAEQVRDALAHLYDPGHLQTHPLAALIGGSDRTSGGRALQQALVDAVETLKPPREGKAGPKAVRRYRLLKLRYVDGLGREAVQRELLVGRSEYYREHRQAVEAVASLVAERLGAAPVVPAAEPAGNRPVYPTGLAGREAETGSAHDLPRRPAFVGRQPVISMLRSALRGACSSHGELVLLVGEVGMGKTRTAEQLAALATDQGVRVLWGSCYEEGAPAFWPWVHALRGYLEEDSPEGLAAGRGPDGRAVGELLVRLGAGAAASDRPSGTGPESERFRLFDAVTTFLGRAARRQPILLVLDDLHWADRSSLRLLEFVARGLARSRVLVLGTCRPEEPSRPDRLIAVPGQTVCRTLPLEGLDGGDVRLLLTEALGAAPSPDVRRAVQDLTEGNPFFVVEIANWLAHETGIDADDASRIRIPDSIKAVVARRLDRLSGPTRELLRIAAVLGPRVDHGLMLEVCGQDREGALLEALDEAHRAHALREDVRGEGYRFRHALIHQVLYEELSPAVRTRLHARVAEILESAYGADAEQHASELAHHFARAQPLLGSRKLVRYSRAAGERSLAAHAYDEAALHFERALAGRTGRPTDAETAALLFGLGRARAATSPRWNRQEAWGYLRRAVEYYLGVGDTRRAVAAATDAALTPEAVTEMAGVIERVLDAVPPGSRDAGWLLARYAAAQYFETGDYQAASRSFARALSIARSTGDSALELRTLALATSVDHFDVRWAGVLEKSARVVALARKHDDPHAENYARYRLAYALAYTGRASEAQPQARANLALAERLADHGLLEDALYVNTSLAQLRGDWADARELSDRGLEVAPDHLPLLHIRALLEFELGETARGSECVTNLLRADSHAGPYPLRGVFPPLVIPQIALLGADEIRFETGPAEPPSSPNAAAMVLVGRALSAVREGNAPEAEIALRLLGPRKGLILGPPLVTDRVLGMLAHTVGRLDQAAAHYEDALSFCRGAGYRPELAWVCYDYARALVARDRKGDRAKAASLLGEAQEISSDLGMRPLHGRATAFRERHGARLTQRPDALTAREVEVLRLLALGKTNKEIARALSISTHTAAAHVAHILAKTGRHNRTEAATHALRELLAEPVLD